MGGQFIPPETEVTVAGRNPRIRAGGLQTVVIAVLSATSEKAASGGRLAGPRIRRIKEFDRSKTRQATVDRSQNEVRIDREDAP